MSSSGDAQRYWNKYTNETLAQPRKIATRQFVGNKVMIFTAGDGFKESRNMKLEEQSRNVEVTDGTKRSATIIIKGEHSD